MAAEVPPASGDAAPELDAVDPALEQLEALDLPGAPRHEAATAALRSVLARAAAVTSDTEQRYAIETQIGEGGMGTVWKARDRELERRVAIKQLARQTSESLARFAREAQAIAQLSHPNIVQVYDVVTDAEVPYIVMEYVEGETFGQYVRALPSDAWRDKLAALVQAGEGLAAAHAAGLVHRDFKPANAMVTAEGSVKVLDFGLVWADGFRPQTELDSDDAELVGGLTQTGAMLGTPAYMAPEQHDGGDADARTDVYAFALSAWEALYGTRPFPGGTLDALADGKRIGPPRDRPDSRIPLAVHRALLRGLAPEPERRWPGMATMLVPLRDGARPRPTRAYWVLGALALVGMAYLGRNDAAASCETPADKRRQDWARLRSDYESALASRLEPEAVGRVLATLDEHVDSWVEQYARTCTTESVSADLARLCLDTMRGQFPVLGQPSEIAKLTSVLTSPQTCNEAELRRLDPRPTDPETATRLEALEAWADAVESRGAAGLPIDEHEVAARVEEARALGYAPATAKVLRLLAVGDIRMEQPALADALEEAFLLASRSGADRLATTIAVRLIVATHRAGQSDQEVQRWVGYARNTLETLEDRDLVDVLFVNAHALVLVERGRPEEALAEVERVWPVIEAEPGVRMYAVRLWERRASANFNLQRFEPAAEAYREVLRLRRILGPSAREEAMQGANLAVALHLGGHLEEAIPAFDRVLDNLTASGLPASVQTVHRINAGRAFMDHPPSVTRAVEVLTQAKRETQRHSDNRIFAVYSLAQAHQAAGDPVAGLANAEEARLLAATEYGPDNPRTLDATQLRDALREEVARGSVE